MRTLTVTSVLALLMSVAAGAPLDVVGTLISDVRASSPGVSDASHNPDDTTAAEPLKFPVPPTGALRIGERYFVALGAHNPEDLRDYHSGYVCGVQDIADAAVFNLDESVFHNPPLHALSVLDNHLNFEALGRYLGAHRYFPHDTFGDPEHSLRVIAHNNSNKGGLWTFVENPHRPDTMLLQMVHSFDHTSIDVNSWYLAISDAPHAKRDSSSAYLTVVDDPARAAMVDIFPM